MDTKRKLDRPKSYLVDLDHVQLVGEVCVELELVVVGDIFAAGNLLENTRFAASQRLERSTKLAILEREREKVNSN